MDDKGPPLNLRHPRSDPPIPQIQMTQDGNVAQVTAALAAGPLVCSATMPVSAAAEQINSAGHQIVAYNFASVDDDPALARRRVRHALAVAGEPDWQPHVAVLDFAAELAELRRNTGSPDAFAAALPDSWVDRLAVVGTPERARQQLAALHRHGASGTTLTPAYPDPRSALDSLARLIR